MSLKDGDTFPVKIEQVDGISRIVVETLEDFEVYWKMMTEGVLIRVKGDPESDRWIPPKEVLLDNEGNFVFKAKT